MGRGRGRAPCCDKNKVKRGPWSPAEDMKLAAFILHSGHKNWRTLPKQAGLLRCGKSCRLRWINYLTPSVKRGNFTVEEEETIIKLHDSYGNRWSKIAAELPGRTDNEIKNVWNTHLKKRLLGKNSKCHNNNTKPIKNDECSSIVMSSSPLAASSATLSTCGDVPCPQQANIATDQDIAVDTMPEILLAQIISPDIAERETSGSSSFSSNASELSSSANEAPNIHLKQSNNVDIVDSEFDIWTVLEDFEKFETKQEQQLQLVPSHLHASCFGDHENYIINHDIELAENGFNDEDMMSLEPEIDPGMLNFQYWPPSPYNI